MESIVVYRSESERLADQFWMNFLSEHPVFCEIVIGIFAFAFTAFFAVVFVTVIRGFWKSRKW
jgi:hypothetical protein